MTQTQVGKATAQYLHPATGGSSSVALGQAFQANTLGFMQRRQCTHSGPPPPSVHRCHPSAFVQTPSSRTHLLG